MISDVYRSLLTAHLKNHPLQICNKWTAELGPISEEQWEYIPELTARLSTCEAQRFSQLLLIRRAYKSPSLFGKIGVRTDSNCPRCSLDNAHIIHMFWECTAPGWFWRDVLDIIHSVHHIRLPADPKVCITGIL